MNETLNDQQGLNQSLWAATAEPAPACPALAEDVPALVNQQRGMACPDAVPGRFQPDLEPNVASFARWYSDAI